MGYNLTLDGSKDGHHATDLCTGGGYTALCDWIDDLSPETYPALHEFAANGTFTGTDKLVQELEDAIANDRPDDDDVFHTADHLADLLGAGRADETAAVES